MRATKNEWGSLVPARMRRRLALAPVLAVLLGLCAWGTRPGLRGSRTSSRPVSGRSSLCAGPFHIAYLTVWVNKDGSMHFRRDVYGRDAIRARNLLGPEA